MGENKILKRTNHIKFVSYVAGAYAFKKVVENSNSKMIVNKKRYFQMKIFLRQIQAFWVLLDYEQVILICEVI